MTDRILSDAEIKHRKKVQGRVSQATGALGLTALGGTLLATKSGSKATKGAFKAIGAKRPSALKPESLRRKTAPILATSAGIGGLGSFNFAAYTNAESRKRGPRQPVQKGLDMDSEYELCSTFGEEGFAKNWSPVSSAYDPEAKRKKRAEAYPLLATGAAGALSAGGALKLGEAVSLRAKSRGDLKPGAAGPLTRKGTGQLKQSRVAVKTAGKLAAASTGAIVASAALERRKKSSSWEPYSKRDHTSAFGVDHD